MAKPEKHSRSGFVIKLSCETVQKLAEEEAKNKKEETEPVITPVEALETDKNVSTINEDSNLEVRNDAVPDNQNNPVLTTEIRLNTARNSSTESIISESNETAPNQSISSENSDSKLEPDTDCSSWGDYAPYITYEGEVAIYTDPNTQQKYTWSKETNSWAPKSGEDVPGRVYSYENDTHIYTESDGSKFFYDVDKKAWIPKVDDDFLAYYQMSYGFVDNTSKDDEKEISKKKTKDPAEKKDPAAAAGVKRKNEPQWFEPSEETNTKVYVSNLPQDLTEEEFVNFMQKCGLVERDPSTQKMKVKLYMDKDHKCFKGDALCTYIKIESVDLALKLLDGSYLNGNKIRVERAHFQLKGEYNPALKPKKRKKKELEKIKKMQQKLFDWRPEKFIGERSKHERVVIVKNLFHPTDFDKEVQLILDYQQDLREECSKSGEVRKVVIYDRHPEGVAQITMKEPEQADAVVQLINGRWFGKRQITAEIWDGRTKYRIAETDADISKRIDKWDKFLEGNEDKNKDAKSKEKTESMEIDNDNEAKKVETVKSDVEKTDEPKGCELSLVEKTDETKESELSHVEKTDETKESELSHVKKTDEAKESELSHVKKTDEVKESYHREMV